MSEHLSPEYVARYLNRSLRRRERIAADDHLGSCVACQRLVSESPDLQSAFVRFQNDLKVQAEIGPSHLTYEQMESYVDGTMSEADCEVVESHAEVCEVCGGELSNLQAFRAGQFLNVGSRAEFTENDTADIAASADEGVRPHWWTAGRLWLGGASAMVIVFAVFFSTIYLRSPDAGRIAQVSSSDNGSSQHSIQNAQEPIASIPPETFETPPGLGVLIGKTGTMLSAGRDAESFMLLSPVGTFVLDDRPEFRWKPLPGVTAYRVAVFDEELNPIESSPVGTGTSWTSRRGLQRGKVYLWQVTAVKGSGDVVAPAPPAPEAKFKIIDQISADEVRTIQSANPGAHFVLGRAYARAGLLDEAEREFRSVGKDDLNFSRAQQFLTSLRALRHP